MECIACGVFSTIAAAAQVGTHADSAPLCAHNRRGHDCCCASRNPCYNMRLRESEGRTPGEVDERLKSHAWKACIGSNLSGVRIPLSPPRIQIGTSAEVQQRPEKAALSPATAAFLCADVPGRPAASSANSGQFRVRSKVVIERLPLFAGLTSFRHRADGD